MRWVTRHEPHLDRCAAAWIIKRFIDAEATFQFIEKGEPIPAGATPFVLPGAEINPVEGTKTTVDVLVEKYRIRDPAVSSIQSFIHDFEVDAGEDTNKTRLRETVGLFKVIRGLARVSQSDEEIVEKAMIVLDALYAQLSTEQEE
mgnify:CR=1 FL=1